MADGAEVLGWTWDRASHRWRVRRGTAWVTCASSNEPPAHANLFAVELDDVTPQDARTRALANAAYLAALPHDLLREALLVFQYEQPDKAARLRALLLGEAVPRG